MHFIWLLRSLRFVLDSFVEKNKCKNNGIAGLGRHLGLQEVEDPSIFRHIKVAKLPVLRRGGYCWYSYLFEVTVRSEGFR